MVDGEAIENVTDHPAFAGVARSAARLFDAADDDPELALELAQGFAEGENAAIVAWKKEGRRS